MKHYARYGVTAGFGCFAVCSLTIASLGQPMMYYLILCLLCPVVGAVCAFVAMEDKP